MDSEDIFREYRKELNAFIVSPESRMIINADQEWYAKHKKDSGGLAGFKLQNGEVVKEFVTIWELFDHREEFQKCIAMLAAKAAEIWDRRRFRKIVSASPTARELAEYLFDALKLRMPDQEFSLAHFGNYPRAALPHSSSFNFKDEYVLILTDVVNRGNLIKTMADMTEKSGGRVAAVLSVLLTNGPWIEEQERQGQTVLLELGLHKARLHNLADYTIRTLDRNEYEEAKVIPIDYNNVLPERRNITRTHYSPAFEVGTMFKHIEDAEAVDFGFYELNDARVTSAVIIPKLLERYKRDIWAHVGEPVVKAARRSHEQNDNGLLLVTTYNRKDLLFKDFIQDRLAEEGYKTTTAITLKRGVTDTPYLNLTLGVGGTDVKGKEIVLALATLPTHEKLRNIVSLLVDGQVKKIIVICLLNRMGPFTTNFIRAIERFTKRVTVDGPASDQSVVPLALAAANGAQAPFAQPSKQPTEFTDFCFSMVYSLLDLRDDDLSSIGSELEWLFSDFRSKTKVPSFVRMCDRIEGYFHSKPFIERGYAPSPYIPLEQPYQLTIEDENGLTIGSESGTQPVTVKTHEAKIALMTYNLALNRDFKPIMEEIVSTTDRRTFIHLYGLLLSDIHHLRFTGVLRKLKGDILSRLTALREMRFAMDIGAGAKISESGLNKIREVINTEVYLLLGIGIIAHYESRDNLKGLDELVVDLLFCGKTPEQWLTLYPLSLQEYFSEERIFFVIAFLLRGLYPEFNRSDTAEKVKAALSEAAGSFRKIFKNRYSSLTNEEKTLKARASLMTNNLDLLLTEIGSHDNLEKHQIVRYLHREVLRPKEGHNPILTTLRGLIEFVSESPAAGGVPTAEALTVDEAMLLTRVDEALSGTSSLDMIARLARQLFFFTPTVQQERYTNPVGQPGFSSDVDELVRKLSDIRQRRSISSSDLERIRELYGVLHTDFLHSSSRLRNVLASYVVCLDEIVESVLHEVNAQLNKEGFSDVLLPAYNDLRSRRVEGECLWPVLGLRQLLRETLRNIFTNLHYAFGEEERVNLSTDAVQLQFEQMSYVPSPERGEKVGVALKLLVKGRGPDPKDFERLENTIGSQLIQVKELGGEWDLNVGEQSFTFVLKLMTRYGHQWRQGASRPADKEQVKKEVELDDEL